ERLAPQILPRLAFLGQVLLDRALRRDARVVVPGLEEHVVALHPPRPHDRVREGELERMAEVEIAGHVRRRVRDRGRWARIQSLGVVQTLGLPGLLPPGLDALRAVERIHGPILRTARRRLRGFIGSKIWTFRIPDATNRAYDRYQRTIMDPR